MFKSTAFLTAAALGLVLAAPAHAVSYITGSITVADGVQPSSLPGAPSTSVVSKLTAIDHDDAEFGAATGCTSVFATESTCVPDATMSDFAFAGPFGVNIIVIDGFTFTITGVSGRTEVPLTFVPTSGTYQDRLTYTVFGTVTGNGYLASAFGGSLAMTGSCNGAVVDGKATCTSDISAGYTYSLTARAPSVPEPGTLGLLGMALAGFGLMRRRSRA